MTVTPVPVGRPISGSPASQRDSSTESRILATGPSGYRSQRWEHTSEAYWWHCCALLVFAQVLGGTSCDTLLRSILYAAGTVIGAFALRSVLSRGSALSLASDGISILV